MGRLVASREEEEKRGRGGREKKKEIMLERERAAVRCSPVSPLSCSVYGIRSFLFLVRSLCLLLSSCAPRPARAPLISPFSSSPA
eukprot:scaffold31563_cov27-Tisochrysis_lutea.AAC.10